MQSIFHPEANQELIARINNLSPITLSQWGKMTVSQMLAHCQQPLKVPLGMLQIKPTIMSFFFGKSFKKQMLAQDKFRKDLPTVKEFRIQREPKFEQAKQELIELVERFAKEGHAAIKVTRHPFFGEMTMEEWDQLQWKHLDHHLRQFGV